jgi:hypothetical protein
VPGANEAAPLSPLPVLLPLEKGRGVRDDGARPINVATGYPAGPGPLVVWRQPQHVHPGSFFRPSLACQKGRSTHGTAPTVATTAYLPALSLPLQVGDAGLTNSAETSFSATSKARRPPPSLSPRKGRARADRRKVIPWRGVERKWCQVKETHFVPSSCPSPSGEGTWSRDDGARPINVATGYPAGPRSLAVSRQPQHVHPDPSRRMPCPFSSTDRA